MDKARHGHILPFHGCFNRVLQGLGSQQTVALLVVLYLDTLVVLSLLFLCYGLVTHDFRVLRTT